MRLYVAAAGLLAVVLSAATFRLWPRSLTLVPARPLTPVVELSDGVASVRVPGRVLVSDVAVFDDELFAWLMFSHLRGIVAQDQRAAWLTYERKRKSLVYWIRIEPGCDLITALPYLHRLRALTRIVHVGYRWALPETISRYRYESLIFDRAYALPARRRLENLPRSELAAYIRRFIRFKATTDRRIIRGMNTVPGPPSRPDAHLLAEDVVTVADFYSLPLDFFLGIGAMENNYLNVRGDIGNTIWKRRPGRGDVILKRGARGVLVLNESSGIWQITRETLRYAHRLFLKDERDYSTLPARLRPSKDLELNEVPPPVLTTYAGLLFCDLLDRFNGDVAKAVGAYNGGPANPNVRYETGVRTIAEYARRVLEHAAALEGRPAAGMRFLTSAP